MRRPCPSRLLQGSAMWGLRTREASASPGTTVRIGAVLLRLWLPGDAQEQRLLVVSGTGGARRPREKRGLRTLLQPQGRLWSSDEGGCWSSFRIIL